ncbi:hypothetical protein [uncultured Clostridium sp.]|nr:hypothetical protein [uncultured Clostridium sp.]
MIKEIKEVIDYKEVNELIKNDWKLLKVVQSQEKIIYVLAKITTKS